MLILKIHDKTNANMGHSTEWSTVLRKSTQSMYPMEYSTEYSTPFENSTRRSEYIIAVE